MSRELSKEEIQERIRDIKWHLRRYKDQVLNNWSDEWRLRHLTPEQDKNWIKGVILGLCIQTHELIDQLTSGLTYGCLEDNFLVRPSKRQKERYSYDIEWVATGMDVGINNIYRQANPNLPEIVEGQTYHSHIKPSVLFKADNDFYGIFSDDPGQQDVIRFEDGTMEGFGSYNFDTVGTALYYWISHICEIGIKRVEDYKA